MSLDDIYTMISYHSDSGELVELIAELGKVYAETVPGSHVLLEEAHILYENLFEEYRRQNDSLRLLFAEIIAEFKLMKRDFDRVTMRCVCKGGHLEILRALRDGSLGKVYPWNEWTTAYAARGGQLEVLRALRNGSLGEICPWDVWTTANAAKRGHLEVLRALRDGSLGEICPWSKKYCKAVTKNPVIIELIESGELD